MAKSKKPKNDQRGSPPDLRIIITAGYIVESTLLVADIAEGAKITLRREILRYRFSRSPGANAAPGSIGFTVRTVKRSILTFRSNFLLK